MPNIMKLSEQPPVWEHAEVANLISGTPNKKYHTYYLDETKQYEVGLWQSDPGAYPKVTDEDEVFIMIKGRVRLTDKDGIPHEFAAGDVALLLKGFDGMWETLEPTLKWFASFKRKTVPGAAA